jgi:hypothetical protein
MHSWIPTTISLAAALALLQSCTAPVVPLIAVTIEMGTAAAWVGAAGGIAGGAASAAIAVENAHHHGKRDAVVEDTTTTGFRSRMLPRQEQNQLAWQECHDDLGSANVAFWAPAEGRKSHTYLCRSYISC